MNDLLDPDPGFLDMTPLIRRKIAWDMLPPDEVAPVLDAMGMAVGSGDILEREYQESIQRQRELTPLLPIIAVLSGLATEVFGTAYMRPVHAEDIASGAAERFNEQNFQVIRSSVFAIIGQLLESGALRMPRPHEVTCHG
jgi:hypothetical protein